MEKAAKVKGNYLWAKQSHLKWALSSVIEGA